MSNLPTIRKPAPPHIQLERLRQWVAEIAALTQPWQAELEQNAEWFEKLADRLPRPLRLKLELLTLRVRHDAA
jgi:GTP-dependent phosphoenolpyruvate carboxykinase